VVLLAALALDGQLSRVDGGMLLVACGLAVLYLVRIGRRGLDVQASGEVGHRLEKGNIPGKWPSLGLFILSLVAIVVGSELLVSGAHTLLTRVGIADLPFGMTILAFLVSIAELERELPAARQGRPEISFGNVLGSMLAFFSCNAGIIALVRPVPVDRAVLTFYLPPAFLTTALVSGVMLTKRVPRWAGGVLVLFYVVFAVGAWLVSGHTVGFTSRWRKGHDDETPRPLRGRREGGTSVFRAGLHEDEERSRLAEEGACGGRPCGTTSRKGASMVNGPGTMKACA